MIRRTMIGLTLVLGLAAAAAAAPPDGALTDAERLGLRTMRQDEKLARDVYHALYERWEDPVFRIREAEQRHMDALARAVARHGMDDPVDDDTRGVFPDPKFTTMYEDLVAAGSRSRLDALKVGARIEDLDILDLRETRAVTEAPDLRRVYDNLERASRNHLRAFASRIEAAGGAYEARHLTQAEFDRIASSPHEPGHGRRGRSSAGAEDGRGRGSGGGCCGGHGGGRGEGRRHRGGRGGPA